MGQIEFGRMRNIFWPVHRQEHRKLIPMLCLFFLITFIYNLLRPVKTTLMITAAGSGAEVMPFLKVWAVLPSAVLFTYLYTRCSNKYGREKTFYIITGLFAGLFALFTLVLFPNRDGLECHKATHFLEEHLPLGLSGLAIIVRYWYMTFFYVLAELWVTIVLSMLFWGFANEISEVDEAKRFYGVFVLASNLSGIVSGQIGQALSFPQRINLPFGRSGEEQTVYLVMGLAISACLAILVIFRYLNVQLALNDTKFKRPKTAAPKVTLSMSESFAYLLRSRYLRYLTYMVVAYNLVYNLSEVLWLNEVKLSFPEPTSFNAYMNEMTTLTGVLSTLMALFMCGTVIRHWGWTIAALVSPIVWIVTSIGFFGCTLLDGLTLARPYIDSLGIPLLAWALFFGSAQMSLGRACKYTLFDETKEIAFIPLSRDSQRKGKAVVDGIAGWVGRAGGALLYQVLLLIFVDLRLTIPYVAGLFLLMTGIWLYSVLELGKMVRASVDDVIPADVTIAPASASETD